MGLATSGIFVSGLILFLFGNFFYYTVNPSATTMIMPGIITTILATFVTTFIIAGANVVGSGINSESLRIGFSITLITCLFWSIDLSFTGLNLGLGIGLASNILSLFYSASMGGIQLLCFGFLALLSIIVTISGIAMLSGGN